MKEHGPAGTQSIKRYSGCDGCRPGDQELPTACNPRTPAPGPLSLDELWRAYLARFDIEHAIRTLKGTLGLTAAKVRTPEQADRWARAVIAAHAQLLLARPLTADLRRPWEKQPDPGRPLTPGRVRPRLGSPARVPKPARPGPGRPKGSSTGPAPRHLLPGEADMPRTTKHDPDQAKVKS